MGFFIALKEIYTELQKIFESQDMALLAKRCQDYQKLYPDNIEILNYHGRSLLILNKLNECEILLIKILQLNENHLEAKLNLARVYTKQTKLDKAIKFYNQLLNQDKSYFVYFELGIAYFKNENYKEAIVNLNLALTLKPDLAEAHFHLGLIYYKFNYLELSLENLSLATQFKKNHSYAYNNIALIYVELFDYDKAIYFYNLAIKYSPNVSFFYVNLSLVYLSRGEFSMVKECCNKALELNSADGEAHRTLSIITNYADEKLHFTQMVSLFNSASLDDNSKMHLSFALGKAYEEKNDFKSASSVLDLGNKIRRNSFQFSMDNEVEQFKLFKEYFSKDFFYNHASTGFKSNKPIFIVGMPRSGTTLVEQIISSHPEVHGGGELSHFANIINKYFDQINPKEFFNQVRKEKSLTFNKIGEDYINQINKISNNKKYITDKMPINFRLIGFIKIALPNAKVIHCQRSAKDTCLSIYKNYFGKNVMPWAYNQRELALYYNLYVDLIDYWNKVLPGFIYNISYENLIQNQEHESKKLIEYCELPWDETCLNFYKNKRSVSTASVNQVRKNIYSSSINIWRNYENEFSELFRNIN